MAGKKKKISAAFAILMSTGIVTARQGWCRASLELLVPLSVPGRRWLDVRETAGPSECVREGSKALQLNVANQRRERSYQPLLPNCCQSFPQHCMTTSLTNLTSLLDGRGLPVSPHPIPEQPLRPAWEIKAGQTTASPKSNLLVLLNTRY